MTFYTGGYSLRTPPRRSNLKRTKATPNSTSSSRSRNSFINNGVKFMAKGLSALQQKKKAKVHRHIPMGNGTRTEYKIVRKLTTPVQADAFTSLVKQSSYANEAVRRNAAVGLQDYYNDNSNNITGWALWSIGDILSAISAGNLTGSNNIKMFLDTARLDMDFTNQSTNTAKMRIWVCLPRIDTPEDPITVFNAASNATDGSSKIALLNFSPYQFEEFVHLFEIVRCDEIILGPGMVHSFSCVNALEKIVNANILQESADAFFRNQSVCVFVSYVGFPENDSVTKTSATVSTAAVSYDCTWSKYLTFRTLSRVVGVEFVGNNLPTSFAVNSSTINPDTDALLTGTTLA